MSVRQLQKNNPGKIISKTKFWLSGRISEGEGVHDELVGRTLHLLSYLESPRSEEEKEAIQRLHDLLSQPKAKAG